MIGSMISTDPRRVRAGLGHGVRASLQNNLSAYGFSVMITASFGVLNATQGQPRVADVFAFLGGAVTGVSVVDGIATHGFRWRFRSEDSDVIALGAALGYVSVGLAVGAVTLVGSIFDGAAGWAVGGFVATTAYVLLSGLELAFARIAQEDREEVEEGAADAD
jgi:hypothetical protein